MSSQTDYESFVGTIVQRFNARAAKFMVAERPMLKPLPARRTAEFEELPARVSKYAIFTIKGVLYSAPSYLIGHRLIVRQYAQHIECWLGGQYVIKCPQAQVDRGAPANCLLENEPQVTLASCQGRMPLSVGGEYPASGCHNGVQNVRVGHIAQSWRY